MYRCDSLFGEDILFAPGDAQVVLQIKPHLLKIKRLQMASCHDPGSQCPGLTKHEVVYEVVLACKDDGQSRL